MLTIDAAPSRFTRHAERREPPDGVLTLLCPEWRGPALVLQGPPWRVAHANWRCRQWLAAQGPATIADGRLVFSEPAFHDRFQACLDHAARFHAASVTLIGETLDGRFAAAIHHPGQACRGYLVVEFASAGQGFEPAARAAFAAAFRLTPAEMEVTELIAMGEGAEAAARLRGSALSTIRQRVKTVLAKTGCRRQLELARLVTALLPARG